MDGEEPEKLSVSRNLSVAGVLVDAVEEIVLFVVIGGQNDKVNDSLQNLENS